ncbi:MAG: hypothetical protein HY755_11055 [Nitrospirae bacterium]|nr:hypothetical protein [Nitrospirota bacterium]
MIQDARYRIFYETLRSQRDTNGNENVIARCVSDVAIFKGEIASPSARNDRIEVFLGEKNIFSSFYFDCPIWL